MRIKLRTSKMGKGPLINPKTWVPYMNSSDCTHGFCSLDCPQLCYIIFPPPPPLPPSSSLGGSSGPNLSPLVIAIIGILASAFLLLSYHALISKYCGNMESLPRHEDQPQNDEEFDEDDRDGDHGHDHEPWVITTVGLDESVIKSIAVCKYRRGDTLVDSTDCSVCLSEFKEEETLRLLPKCGHAFHVSCIDTWLKSHSNCPLCRANVVQANACPIQSPTLEIDPHQNHHSTPEDPPENHHSVSRRGGALPYRGFSDGEAGGDIVIEVGEVGGDVIRRSVSMDHSQLRRVWIADIVSSDLEIEDSQSCRAVGPSKGPVGETSKPSSSSRRSSMLNCVMGSVAMTRSLSSGRFVLSRHGRGLRAVIPL
ncbi:hypothetical protein Nepgr_031642 [Nepenthes gracilis]|uniref:RING-type E3 ubiquitin transferase n=1 Tax=Nepenthes gracilis TaxID=150966 RepID=A0AAD3TIJ2_NEPGR|nr:hypothetical protein Nepgr_031642 [Nepenthes gracilis]